MQDDFKMLALKIECAQITARRNMQEVIGVGLRPTDQTFLSITDRFATITTRQMFFCKFCVTSTFHDLRSYNQYRSSHVTTTLQRSKSKVNQNVFGQFDNGF